MSNLKDQSCRQQLAGVIQGFFGDCFKLLVMLVETVSFSGTLLDGILMFLTSSGITDDT